MNFTCTCLNLLKEHALALCVFFFCIVLAVVTPSIKEEVETRSLNAEGRLQTLEVFTEEVCSVLVRLPTCVRRAAEDVDNY